LTLNAPVECGTADGMQVAVEALLQQMPAEPLRATLTIRHTEGGYVAELRTHSAALREISATSCEAVVEAATVILALAIDPSAGTRTKAPAHMAVAAKAQPAERPREPLAFRAGANSTFDSSTLPHLALGASLRAGVSARQWSALLAFTAWLPATASLPESPQSGGRFTWWTVGVSGCFAPISARGFGLCLSPELGLLEGTGFGGQENFPVSTTWLAIALAPEFTVALSPHVLFRSSLGMAVSVLGHHPFVLERSGETVEVHQPGRFSARAAMGLDVAF